MLLLLVISAIMPSLINRLLDVGGFLGMFVVGSFFVVIALSPLTVKSSDRKKSLIVLFVFGLFLSNILLPMSNVVEADPNGGLLTLKWIAYVTPGAPDDQIHPVIGDINGDGQMEVVMSTKDCVVALNGSDGSELWRYYPANHRAITLSDLTNDGIPEVLAANGRRVIALFGNGTLYWQSQTLNGDQLCDFPITAYDINGDGYPMIYFAGEDTEPGGGYTGSLTALNHEG